MFMIIGTVAALLLSAPEKLSNGSVRYTSCTTVLDDNNQEVFVDRIYHVHFKPGSVKIDREGKQILNSFADNFDAPSYCEVGLGGHADRVGTIAKNLVLSQGRVNAVIAYLRRRGLKSPIRAKAFGEAEPLVETADEIAEPQNRFVVVYVYD